MTSTRKEIGFLINKIVINSAFSTIKDFEEILGQEVKTEKVKVSEEKEEILSITEIFKEIREDRFILLHTLEGNRFPYADKVIDSRLQEIKNPRSADEIEPKEQFFALIDTKTSRIFLSDQRKKTSFLNWLRQKTKKDISINPLFEENYFIEKIESVKEISLTVEPGNMFSESAGTLAEVLKQDVYGFDAVQATLTLAYNKKRVSEKMLSLIRNIFSSKTAYKNITVVGRTNDNFESTFNMAEITSKILVDTVPEESTQMIDHNLLFTNLITKIKDNDA